MSDILFIITLLHRQFGYIVWAIGCNALDRKVGEQNAIFF